MKIQDTQTVIFYLNWFTFIVRPRCSRGLEASYAYQQYQKLISASSSAHWRAETFYFISAYLHYRTLSTGCQKHSRLSAYYRNIEMLIPLLLCTYHPGNEDRQAAQLLSPRKAKITAKDRSNACSESFPHHYGHDGKPKKCQVTEGCMSTFMMERKKKERKVEIGHCHLIWLHFYFSLYFGWSSGVLTKVYGARSSAKIYKLYLHINMLDKFYS